MIAGKPDPAPNPQLEQAIDWLLRLQASPGDRDLQAALGQWVAADDRNARAWVQAQRTWQLIGEVPPVHASPVAAAAPPLRVAPSAIPRRRRIRRIAAAALAACLLLAMLPALQLRIAADHTTGTGESRRIALEDGSVIHLGAASAIATNFEPARRGVTLLTGEAFFEVAPDRNRPFVVAADGMEVTVLGTAFDVRLGSRTHVVGVQSGAVGVRYRGNEQTVDARLSPGQQLTVQRQSGAAMLAAVSPRDVAGWRDARLFVQDATVADAIETLQRYHSSRIFIADAALAEHRITGSYDLRDPDRALAALVEPHEGRVLELTPLLRVLRAR